MTAQFFGEPTIARDKEPYLGELRKQSWEQSSAARVFPEKNHKEGRELEKASQGKTKSWSPEHPYQLPPLGPYYMCLVHCFLCIHHTRF